MNTDIKNLKKIKEQLDSLEENDVLFIDEQGKTKYAVLTIETYDAIEDVINFINGSGFIPQVKIAGSEDIELTYDEYERIKSQILEAVEKTLRPKPEKLN